MAAIEMHYTGRVLAQLLSVNPETIRLEHEDGTPADPPTVPKPSRA